MRIGIDIDGVVADTYPFLSNWFRQTLGADVTLLDIVEMHRPGGTALSGHFDRHADQLYVEVPAMRGARAALGRLAVAAEVHLVSARDATVRPATEAWLQRRRLTYHHLHLLSGGDKAAVCRELGIDLFIEDNPRYARAVAASGVRVLLFDAPYNRDLDGMGVTRVRTWREVLSACL